MKNILMMLLLALFVVSCSGMTKIDVEESNGDNLTEVVPTWYLEYPNKKKDKNFIYGAGTSTSPDLQLAIEKATMIAKAALADQLQGEMNQRTELYITEIGSNTNKEVASKIESTIVNVIAKTMVQGYETWEKAVYETPVGQYRVYIGLKMGVGDANRLAKYIAENANNDVDIDELAENAIEEVL